MVYHVWLKVAYVVTVTAWSIYHGKYDIFHAIKVDNEVCMLFSTVQISHFQVEVAQTIITSNYIAIYRLLSRYYGTM
jgi:hypothetical protein